MGNETGSATGRNRGDIKMNIKEAKEQIKNAVIAYFTRNSLGEYMMPIEKQRVGISTFICTGNKVCPTTKKILRTS